MRGLNTEQIRNSLAIIFELDRAINSLQEDIELKSARLEGFGGLGLGVKTSRRHDWRADLIAEIIDLQGERAELCLKLLKVEEEAYSCAAQITDATHKSIFIWRHICRLKWDEVAKRADLSIPQVMRAHNAAIKEISQTFFEGMRICS